MFRANHRWILIAVAAALITLLATAHGYLPFVADDALISFRYSERLLDGKGLTFTDGERVEGYSNALWVLVVAAGGLITRDLILVGRIAGTIAMCLAVVAFIPVLRVMAARSSAASTAPAGARAAPAAPAASGVGTIDRLSPLAVAMPAFAGLSLLALSHGPAIWAIGGLEQGLQTALLAWAMTLIVMPSLRADSAAAPRADDVPLAAGVILALLVWTRPDGALFVALAAGALILVHGMSMTTVRAIGRLAALPALAWFAQLAFRLVYYDDWFPNTAYAKLAMTRAHVLAGLHYLGEGLWSHVAIVIAAAAGLLVARPFRRREIVVPLVIAIGWSLYVISVGGDTFPGRRHFLPVLLCLVLIVTVTWRRGLGRLPLAAQIAALIVLGAIHVHQQRGDEWNDVARRELWEWDCGLVMSTVRTAFAETQPLIAADPIGCVGYFGKLPTLDMLGLTDRYLAHHRPADFGTGHLGHELGDGRYVLSRSPAIVFPCTPGAPPGACFRSGIEMFAMKEFQQRYALVAVYRSELLFRPFLWFDVTSAKLGVVRTDREIRLPGFLFAGPGVGYALLSADGRLVAKLATDAVATLDKPAAFPSVSTAADAAARPWIARAIASEPMEVSIEGSVIRVKTGPRGGELAEVVLSRRSGDNDRVSDPR